MTLIIKEPSIIKAAGNKEIIIKECFGYVNSKISEVSIAHLKSPEGWEEPGQCPEFNEYTIVLKGSLKIKTKKEEFIVSEGMGILTTSDEWIQYSSPFEGGAKYIAICLPAFSPEIAHRDKG
ncbi:MAG: hypothetical protein Q8N38_09150 [Bacteroidales bacterium]|nr:hypothetical protein [Bacteroidales bacterium]